MAPPFGPALSVVSLGALIAISACSHQPLPSVRGSSPTATSAGTPWTPPAERIAAGAPMDRSLPTDLAPRRNALSVADLVALALARNPETSAAWSSARATAARLGETRSDLYPRIIGNLSTSLSGATSSGVRSASSSQSIGPSLSLSWLLFDYGGRAANISAAESALLAADWSHNAVLADVARRTAQAYFDFAGTQSLLEAERLNWEQAKTNLSSAEDRRAVGIATIADVLQARTAVAQALLSMQSAEGAVATTRGVLATLAGLAPTTSFDIDTLAAFAPLGEVTDSVDALIARALVERPDLASARAIAEQRHQEVRAFASQRKPSLGLSSVVGQDWSNGNNSQGSYQIGLGLSVPLFNGYGWQFATQAAELAAEAQDARTRQQEQQVGLQVFITYQSLRTATQRVRAADDLLASATESADAARARYRGEVGTLIELLNAERALADARAQRIQARVQWQTQLVQLGHDAGMLGLDGTAQVRITPLPIRP